MGTRNYFYCGACAPSNLLPCVHCAKPQRRESGGVWGRRAPGGGISFLSAEFVGPTFINTFVHSGLATNPEALFPGFGIPALTSVIRGWICAGNEGTERNRLPVGAVWMNAFCVCHECWEAAKQAHLLIECCRCHVRYSPECSHAVELPPTAGQPAEVSYACRSCLPSMRTQACVRCNQVCYEHQMVWADNHSRQRVCRQCSKQAMNKPGPGERLIGFELEMLIPEDVSLPALTTMGRLHDDGSIHRLATDQRPLDRYYVGREFASFPASGATLKKQIWDTMEYCVEMGAYVNRSCGLHTHYDMSKVNNDALARTRWWWLTLEPLIMMMVPEHRRNNRYCRRVMTATGMSMAKQTAEHLTNYGWSNRYHALNLESFTEHGTYEVRMFHATLAPKDLWMWTRFIDSVFKMAATTEPRELLGSRARQKLAELLSICTLPLSVKKFMVQSLAKYNDPVMWAKAALPLMPVVSSEGRSNISPVDVPTNRVVLSPPGTAPRVDPVMAAGNPIWTIDAVRPTYTTISPADYRLLYDPVTAPAPRARRTLADALLEAEAQDSTEERDS